MQVRGVVQEFPLTMSKKFNAGVTFVHWVVEMQRDLKAFEEAEADFIEKCGEEQPRPGPVQSTLRLLRNSVEMDYMWNRPATFSDRLKR